MSRNERLLGDVMLGLMAGCIVWAILGSWANMLVRDDLYMIGHQGGRGASDAHVDRPY